MKKIVIIGGGPAGIEAAKAAARAGGEVTIISNEPIGGRAGWHSLLPSKVWLTAVENETKLVDPQAIVARIKTVKESWNGQQQAELADLGVVILRGTAVFTSPHTVTISHDDGESSLTADSFIVATGSVPVFPPTMKPNGKNVLAPRFASALNTLPPSVVVVGGGVTGTEFAYLFNRLGLDVTWVVDKVGVLPEFDAEAGQVLADEMVARGVRLVVGHRAERIDQIADGVSVVLTSGEAYLAAMAFLAIGRKPDVAGLNLEAAGAELPSHIYLVGDATGKPMIANRATAQAWAAGQAAAGQTPISFSENTVIAAVYSEPQVAQVGQLSGDGIETVRVPFSASLKGHLLPQGEAFVKLAYVGENASTEPGLSAGTELGRSGRLVGAAAVGHHAADVLAPVMVAIQAGMTVQELAALYAAHPTLSELAFAAARAA
ncbi:MAG: NAD(P)/FAD-dependent oxidoreductase [Anaerolineae bacterium]|nr:NAD(P)/FAD-dependent oxidoreductase [Anaerolineae bacterium]